MCEFKVFVEMCSECSFRRRTGLKESTWSGCVMGGGEGGAFLSSLQERRDGLDDPWGMRSGGFHFSKHLRLGGCDDVVPGVLRYRRSPVVCCAATGR